MMYNKTYYTGASVEPCEGPPTSCLHDGLEWDEDESSHCTRLTPKQIETGLAGGYLLYEDPRECRYRVWFQLVPGDVRVRRDLLSVYRLIIDTSLGRMRPISVMVESNISARQDFLEAHRDGETQ